MSAEHEVGGAPTRKRHVIKIIKGLLEERSTSKKPMLDLNFSTIFSNRIDQYM